MAEKEVVQVPFFAQFLESQEKPTTTTRHKTLKFPSDIDEWDD